MIYSLLQQHLHKELLGQKYQLTEFELLNVLDNIYQDKQDFKYFLNIPNPLQSTLVVQSYRFEYEYNFENNTVDQLNLIIEKVNDDQANHSINLLQYQHAIPTLLIQKAFIKKQTPQPALQSHQIHTLISQSSNYQRVDASFCNLDIVQRSQNIAYRQPTQDQSIKKRVKVEKSQPIDIDSIKLSKTQDTEDSKIKKEIKVSKQLFKQQHKKHEETNQNQYLKSLVKKLDIPEKWKQVSQEFSESHKKVWDIKYYEKLMLLTEAVSKKYFYSHIFKECTEEEYQKRFIRYALPPDLQDQSIIKKRKIYSKDVVCALFE
ncbi:unnamed protein product (macronuclear) [Paramecium tetraurelia]|uniref:Uncharacterized protein n=1 Tax=Paramecium tetraurelia TaxID=5888 RepID=A0DZB3_PARTE|nr:uncharacterized protein GSPATT00003349001 [Paramecium tetraurelia]CAK88380.1 unnamed protein product [Paramecium tetraurelia]|eukprot:XP_001455777.1 hypothetical protein (macronuclear) [Paramecium tetraurelia strain d4-2]